MALVLPRCQFPGFLRSFPHEPRQASHKQPPCNFATTQLTAFSLHFCLPATCCHLIRGAKGGVWNGGRWNCQIFFQGLKFPIESLVLLVRRRIPQKFQALKFGEFIHHHSIPHLLPAYLSGQKLALKHKHIHKPALQKIERIERIESTAYSPNRQLTEGLDELCFLRSTSFERYFYILWGSFGLQGLFKLNSLQSLFWEVSISLHLRWAKKSTTRNWTRAYRNARFIKR